MSRLFSAPAGTIRAVKLRSRTFIVMDSLRQFIASLPAAKFRAD